jgi:predicted kinase
MILNISDRKGKKVYIRESQLDSLGNASDDGRYSSCGFEMLVGIPGCGKSTYLKRFKNKKGIVIVCPDDIRRELFNDVNHQADGDRVWGTAHTRIYEALEQGSYVILDATNVGTRNRVRLLNNVKSMYPGVPCYATVFDCNPEVSKQRIARDIENHVDRSDVPADVIDRMYKNYLETLEVIKDEGFDGVFFV